MIYSGTALNASLLSSGIVNLTFDLDDSSVNKFNEKTLKELGEAVDVLKKTDAVGLIFSSAKPAFIVGADITEFTGMFAEAKETIEDWLVRGNQIFNDIEDLPYPTVSAVNGMALGGGFELALATDFRVGTDVSVVGFLVKLGILPGFGGTVRLPRLIGADNANQWIGTGSHFKANQALAEGAIDAIVGQENLISACEDLIRQSVDGKIDYQRVREQKKSPLTLSPIELNVAFETALGLIAAQAGKNYPAPITAGEGYAKKAASSSREAALKIEHAGFVKLAKTEVAKNLVQMFLNDQFLNSKAKKFIKNAPEVNKAGVLGAGIMGGGIAYQSALKGTPILMKDIAKEGLDLGMNEASKLLNKRRLKGKIDAEKVVSTLSDISPVLDYKGFDEVDIIIEAIVENVGIKDGSFGARKSFTINVNDSV